MSTPASIRTPARRFVLIESNSGNVWWDPVRATTPVRAARRVDDLVDPGTSRVTTYYEHGPGYRFDLTENGYHVYEVPHLLRFPNHLAGDDRELTELVKSFEKVAVVETVRHGNTW